MTISRFPIGKGCAELISYIHDDLTPFCDTYKERPAVVICPGGAYQHLSPREQEPVAIPLFSAGFQVFVLLYSVGDDIKNSEPEEELAKAIAFIKEKFFEFNVISKQIAVLGFSAGGHLAASLCCHWHSYGKSSKPDCGILCYPVITTGIFGNEPSTKNLTFLDEKRLEYFSLERQVSDKTLPCFIWHTTEDKSVPIQNSLMFVEALTRNNIPYEYHVFQKGGHGLALGHRETGKEEKGVQGWLSLCISWLYDRWRFTL